MVGEGIGQEADFILSSDHVTLAGNIVKYLPEILLDTLSGNMKE